MKRTKKILIGFLATLSVLSGVFGLAACGDTGDSSDTGSGASSEQNSSVEENAFSQGLSYTLLDDDTYAVTGIGDCTDTEIVVPSSYNGKAVTSIGDGAFRLCSGLTSIAIPDGITSIGDGAFLVCYNLTSIIIPDSVTSIGVQAFFNCGGLTSITIGDGVTSIGDNAFDSCDNLTSITIGDSVTSIGDNAFDECYKLVEVVNKSTHITIEKGSRKNGGVGYYALAVYNSGDTFTGTKISSDNGYIVYSDETEKILMGYTGTETDLILPTDITKIHQYALYGCDHLTSVVIPDSVTSIGDFVFNNCYNLKCLTIGNSVASIGDDAFAGCSKLVEIVNKSAQITIEKGSRDNGYVGYYALGVYNSGDAFTGTKISSDNGYIIYSGETGKVLIDYTGTETDLILPSDITEINRYAFYDCEDLTSVVIPDSVISIGDAAFAACDNLTSATIGDNVTSIGYSVFSGCDNFTSVTCPVFAVSYVPKNNLQTVKITSGDSISSYAFTDCNSLMSVNIGDSVSSIGNYAFSGCGNLTSVTIGNGVTNIGLEAFSGCYDLKYNVKDNLKYLGNEQNSYLYLVGVNDISIVNATIESTCKIIGSFAFADCDSLTSISIPDAVMSIGSYAFNSCTSLTTIIFNGTVEEWNAIEKGNWWNYNIATTKVVCSDEEITL